MGVGSEAQVQIRDPKSWAYPTAAAVTLELHFIQKDTYQLWGSGEEFWASVSLLWRNPSFCEGRGFCVVLLWQSRSTQYVAHRCSGNRSYTGNR